MIHHCFIATQKSNYTARHLGYLWEIDENVLGHCWRRPLVFKTFFLLIKFQNLKIKPIRKPEVTSDQSTPDQCVQWSDWNAFETPCSLGVLSKLFLIRRCQPEVTSDQTEIRPLSRPLCDHSPDQTQTIVQTIVRSELLLIRILCAQNSLLIRLLCAHNRLR